MWKGHSGEGSRSARGDTSGFRDNGVQEEGRDTHICIMEEKRGWGSMELGPLRLCWKKTNLNTGPLGKILVLQRSQWMMSNLDNMGRHWTERSQNHFLSRSTPSHQIRSSWDFFLGWGSWPKQEQHICFASLRSQHDLKWEVYMVFTWRAKVKWKKFQL